LYPKPLRHGLAIHPLRKHLFGLLHSLRSQHARLWNVPLIGEETARAFFLILLYRPFHRNGGHTKRPTYIGLFASATQIQLTGEEPEVLVVFNRMLIDGQAAVKVVDDSSSLAKAQFGRDISDFLSEQRQ
jgi:hypothetical protein